MKDFWKKEVYIPMINNEFLQARGVGITYRLYINRLNIC